MIQPARGNFDTASDGGRSGRYLQFGYVKGCSEVDVYQRKNWKRITGLVRLALDETDARYCRHCLCGLPVAVRRKLPARAMKGFGNSYDANSERRKIAEYVGTRQNATILFRPKIVDTDLERIGELILGRLDFKDGTNTIYSNFDRMSDSGVSVWATVCWANTVAHLCEIDTEVRTAVSAHRTFLPDDTAAQDLLIKKVHAAFQSFLWLLACPTRPLTPDNRCVIKLIVLQDAILLEEIHARKDGSPGGWGLLDKTLDGLRDVAAGFEIDRVKTIATNEQVYRAFLRRGFRDLGETPGLTRYVENYAKPLELSIRRQL